MISVKSLIDEEYLHTISAFKNTLMIILILTDVLFVSLMILYPLTMEDLVFFSYFDLLICTFMFLDLVNTYINSDSTLLGFIKGHIIDIIAVIPINFIFLRYFVVTNVFRVLQLFQVAKLFSLRRYERGGIRYFIRHHLLRLFVILFILYIFISSTVLYVLDPAFTSIFNSLWFNIVTLASVGYGDITPSTPSGKILGMISIILGVFFVSVFTAAMAALYNQENEKETRRAFQKEMNVIKKENRVLDEKIDDLDDKITQLNDKLDLILEKKE